MKKRVFVIVGIMLASAITCLVRPAVAASAAEILGWCSSAEYEALCRGYLWAIVDASSNPDMIKNMDERACPPDDIDISNLKVIIVERLSRLPGLENTRGGAAITPIIVEMYPCK